MKRPLVAFVSPSLAVRDYHGGCAYAAAILEELGHAGCDILHLWLADLHGRRPFRLPVLPAGGKVRVFGALCLGRLVIPLPWGSADKASFLRRQIRASQPDLALLDRAPTAAMWQKDARCQAWIITHDLLQRRSSLYEAHGYQKDFQEASGSAEQQMLARADGIIAIQDQEAEMFRAMLPDVPVMTVPHPVRLDPLPLEKSVSGTLLFIGGSAAHNVDGIQWFMKEVLPLLLKKHPEVVIEVAGSVAELLPDHPALRRLGHVDDLRSLYQRAQVCLAPLRFGTGLKIKVMEAMGYGRPVVATSAAAEGFDDLAAALGGVNDSPEAFAETISLLLRDEQERMQSVARQNEWVKRHIIPEVAIRPLLERLNGYPVSQLIPTPRRIVRNVLLACLIVLTGFVAGVIFQKRVTVGYTAKWVKSWFHPELEAPVEYHPQGGFYGADELHPEPTQPQQYDEGAALKWRSDEIVRLEGQLPMQKAFWARSDVQEHLTRIQRAAEIRQPSVLQMRLQRYYSPGLPQTLLQPPQRKEEQDATEAIVEFAHKLKAEGRHLIFVPLPNPVDVDLPLFMEQKDYTSIAFLDTEFFLKLLRGGVDVFDLRESFARANLGGKRPFYRADHHWTAEGMNLAAEDVSRNLVSAMPDLASVTLKARMSRLPVVIPEVTCNSDFAPVGMRFGDTLAEYVTLDGKPVRQSPRSPVLVLGDSNVVHLEGTGCDFTSQLAYELGSPLASFGRIGGGSQVPKLYDEMLKKTGVQPSVVIWVSINGGWRGVVSDGAGKGKQTVPLVAAPDRLIGSFVVVAASKPPDPKDATYPDALYTFKVKCVSEPGNKEAVVITWAFKGRRGMPERRVSEGATIELNLPTWDHACKGSPQLARIQQVDSLNEFALPVYFWDIAASSDSALR